MNTSSEKPIIIDNGTGTCKAGFAGDKIPSVIANTFVGIEDQTKDIFVSNDAYQKADLLNLSFPIDHRIINNFDDIEKIWKYIFSNELHIEPSSHPVLITDYELNTKENREKMMQIMFETFNVPSFYVAKQSVLSLYSSGRLNGVVLDLGYSTTSSTPIYNGYYIANTSTHTNIGGKNITEFLQKQLNEKGNNFTTFSQQEMIRDIKESNCYVSIDFESEIKQKEIFKEFTLPDGKVIQIGKELFQSPELLINPQINGIKSKGIIDILIESIQKCDMKLRDELYSSIVIAGGTSKLNNLTERIQKELSKKGIKAIIIEPHKRQYASWIGGSIFASLPTFNDTMIKSSEYNESGIGIIRKCP